MNLGSHSILLKFTRYSALFVSSVLLLSACGGGGDDSPASSPTSFQISTAMTAFSQDAHQFNLGASVGADTMSMSYSYSPSVASQFEGRLASTALLTVIFRLNGAVLNQGSGRVYFSASPYVSYGIIDQNSGAYTVVNQLANLPITARVGDSGAMGSRTTYTDSTKTRVSNTATLTWNVESETPTTALFCTNIVFTDMTMGTVSDCYRINTAGQVVGLVLRLQFNGQILTLR